MMIIKVDENDLKIGEIEKMEAHKKGVLHRAFSVFIFNNKNEMLLQKRADDKYHSGSLWTNACCSHPISDDIKKDAESRLFEEMGFTAELKKIGFFRYKAKVGDLIENEADHLFLGTYNDKVHPNPSEVSDYKWISLSDLDKELNSNEKIFTEWFKIIYPEIKHLLNNEN